jgi:ribosomal protein L7/L12
MIIEVLPYFLGTAVVLIWIRVEQISTQINELQNQMITLRRELGFLPGLSTEPSERVRSLAADATKTLEAIRAYREESGADLKAAKSVVEQLRNGRSAA